MTRLHLDQNGQRQLDGGGADWFLEQLVDRRLPFQFPDASLSMLERTLDTTERRRDPWTRGAAGKRGR
ncbi:hypothetical protein [Arthrobacter sp. UYEF21]|uniref:hypothetical protein n=1 Tax=Arthrobacter sp. UYEF21 TaxID=1756364 RepID=UPI0033969518